MRDLLDTNSCVNQYGKEFPPWIKHGSRINSGKFIRVQSAAEDFFGKTGGKS